MDRSSDSSCVGPFTQSIRPYVCGASIMALRKPNGQSVRRLTSKVAVDLITERAREIFDRSRYCGVTTVWQLISGALVECIFRARELATLRNCC